MLHTYVVSNASSKLEKLNSDTKHASVWLYASHEVEKDQSCLSTCLFLLHQLKYQMYMYCIEPIDSDWLEKLSNALSL